MFKKCRCWDNGLKEGMTWDELLEQIVRPQKYCTAGSFICPQLDRELRRADAERTRVKYYKKRLKAQGMSTEQIEKKKYVPRNRPAKYKKVDLSVLDAPKKRRKVVPK